MPYGKCGEASAGVSCRSGGVESRNSSDLLPAESRAPDGKAELLPSREVLYPVHSWHGGKRCRS